MYGATNIYAMKMQFTVAVNDLSYEIGFRNGDRILDFDGVPVEDFAMLQSIWFVHRQKRPGSSVATTH